MNSKIIMLTADDSIDRRILLQAESLRQAGYQVEIISKQDLKNNSNKLPTTLNIIYKPYYFLQSISFFNKYILKFLKSVFCLLFGTPADFQLKLFWPYVSDKVADVFVAHDLPMLPLAYACAQKNKAKLVYDSHELFVEQEFSLLDKWLWRSLEKKFIVDCNLIMTINDSIAGELKSRYSLAEVKVIQNATKKMTFKSNENILQKKFQLKPESKIILYQGNLSDNRNIISLVQAMRYVKNPHIHAVLLGNGAYSHFLKNLVKDLGLTHKIHFHEAVAQEQLLAYTACADLGLIPYLPTCLNNALCTPNKLFEYIAAGVPIIAHDLIEIRKMLNTFNFGYITNLTCYESLGTKLDHLLGNPNILHELKINALAAREKINWQHEEKLLVKMYQNILPLRSTTC